MVNYLSVEGSELLWSSLPPALSSLPRSKRPLPHGLGSGGWGLVIGDRGLGLEGWGLEFGAWGVGFEGFRLQGLGCCLVIGCRESV